MGKLLSYIIILLAITATSGSACAEGTAATLSTSDITSLVYFTGVGCPHCAKADPVLLKYRVRQGGLLVVEYEIYRDSINGPLMLAYNSQFDSGLGVPLLMANAEKGSSIVGDRPIIERLAAIISTHRNNGIVLPAGQISIDKLLLSDLPKKPKLWFKNRIAIREDVASKESDSIKKFLFDGTLPQYSKPIKERAVAISGDKIIFNEAFSYGGWILMRD